MSLAVQTLNVAAEAWCGESDKVIEPAGAAADAAKHESQRRSCAVGYTPRP
jgi:hypothetical protein